MLRRYNKGHRTHRPKKMSLQLGPVDLSKVHIITNTDDATGKSQQLALGYALLRGIPLSNIHNCALGNPTGYYLGCADHAALRVYADQIRAVVRNNEPTHVIFSSRCPDAYYCSFFSGSEYITLDHIVRVSWMSDEQGIWNDAAPTNATAGAGYWPPATFWEGENTVASRIPKPASGHLGGDPRSENHNRWVELINETYEREQNGGICCGTAYLEYAGYAPWEDPTRYEGLVDYFEKHGRFNVKCGWPTDMVQPFGGARTQDYLLTRSTVGMGASDGICSIDPANNTTEAACTGAGGVWYPWQSGVSVIDAGQNGNDFRMWQLDRDLILENCDIYIANWMRNREYVDVVDWRPGSFFANLTSFALTFGWGALEAGAGACFGVRVAHPAPMSAYDHSYFHTGPLIYGATIADTCAYFEYSATVSCYGDPLYRPLQLERAPYVTERNLPYVRYSR